jgi:hypothetical protein
MDFLLPTGINAFAPRSGLRDTQADIIRWTDIIRLTNNVEWPTLIRDQEFC